VNFLNPLFLFGLAAAAIPIIIHLFTRRRPRELHFPSLEFLSEVNQSEIRRLRIKQWLLLLLRTLAIAAIALAMARPALRGNLGPQSRAATTVVALVDRSASMGAIAPGTDRPGHGATLADEGRRVVEDLIASLGPADEMLLIPYDDTPHPMTARPISDLARVRSAAQAITPTSRTTSHDAALAAASKVLAESRSLNRELFWISDFQAGGFHAGDGAWRAPAGPWDQTRTYLIEMAPRSRANAALSDAALTPTENEVGLAVAATSFGAAAGDLAVEVRETRTSDELGRGFVNLPERGEASSLLPLARVPEEGGVARIPDDALPLDNARTFASGRAGTLRIVLREDGPISPVRLALEAGSPASGLELVVAGAGTLAAQAGGADALVINDVERLGSAEIQSVLDFYRAGGAVLVVLGSRADPEFWNGTLLREMKAGTLGGLVRTPAGAWRLQRAVAGHPVLAGFPGRPGEPLSSARFTEVREFKPGAETRTVLEYDRSHPALVEVPHGLVLLGPLDPSSTDFPVSGAFLPLLHQSARVLGRGTASASLSPGDRFGAPAGSAQLRVEDPEGKLVESEIVVERGAARLRSAPLERTGLYRVTENGKLRSTFAVNPSLAESDLEPLADAVVIAGFPRGHAQWVRPGADLAQRVREARYGRELWSFFLTLALLLLAAETLLARFGMPGAAPAGAAKDSRAA